MQFADLGVTYDQFLTDLAARLARSLKEQAADPEYLSHRQASAIFGRANVERWRASGLSHGIRKGGKILYRTSELRQLMTTEHETLKPDYYAKAVSEKA